MNTSQLRCFLAVAETLNFTEAAKSLYMSQPALSKQISLIEQELGMQLFDRTRRYVRLTPQGEVLYHDLRNISLLLNSAVVKAKAISEDVGGTLTVGITTDNFSDRELPGAVNNFCSCYPNVALDITIRNTNVLRNGLDSGTMDLILCIDYEIMNIQDISSVELCKRKLNYVIGKQHPLAGLDNITLVDLSSEAFITIFNDNDVIRNMEAFEINQYLGYTPKKLLKAPNPATQKLWVAAGMGVSLMDLDHSPWMRGSVKCLDMLPSVTNTLMAAWKTDNPNPFIPRFLNLLMAAMSNHGNEF